MQRIKILTSVLAFVVGCGGSQSQTESDTATSSSTEGSTVDLTIHASRVFVGDGQVLRDMTVIVDDGKIVEIVATAESTYQGETEIDAPQGTLLPGLINTHAHLISATESEAAAQEYVENELPSLLQSFLELGFTTLRSPGDAWPLIGQVRDDLAANEIVGPRLHVVGPVLTIPGAHPEATVCKASDWCKANVTRALESPEQARSVVQTLAAEGTDQLKFVYEEDDIRPQASLTIIEALISESANVGITISGHAFPGRAAIEARDAGVGALVHTPFGSEMSDAEVVDKLGAIPVTTTLGIRAPIVGPNGELQTTRGMPWTAENQVVYDGAKARVLALWQAHQNLNFGTDTTFRFYPDMAFSISHERDALLDAGLTPTEVLTIATGNGARALEIDDELGFVAPGMLADLVLVDGDPTADIEAMNNIRAVWQSGILVVDKM